MVPERRRVGPFRVIFSTDLPRIEAALRKAGYLTAE
jgi:hypothetical protein